MHNTSSLRRERKREEGKKEVWKDWEDGSTSSITQLVARNLEEGIEKNPDANRNNILFQARYNYMYILNALLYTLHVPRFYIERSKWIQKVTINYIYFYPAIRILLLRFLFDTNMNILNYGLAYANWR